MSRFVNLEFNRQLEDESQNAVAKDGPYHLREAQQAFEQAEFERALRQFSKVLEFDPHQAAAWIGQVRALIELEEFQEARLWADKALERFPREAELLAAKAVALGRLGDLQAALAFSDAAIAERGDTAYLWLARGDVLLARSEKRADYCFEKALALAPRDWFITWLAARVRFFHAQFAQALHLLQSALEWNPTHAALWLQAGLCQRRLGLFAAAQTSFTQARQLNPQCRAAGVALAEVSAQGFFSRLAARWRQAFRR